MTKKNNRVVEMILETAGDMHRLGLLDDEEFQQITVRHLGAQTLPTAEPISAKEIRSFSSANLQRTANWFRRHGGNGQGCHVSVIHGTY